MSKVTMYPTSLDQPNRNKSSGMQGNCHLAVKRDGSTYAVNCKYQNDPKYCHEWSNAEEILEGKQIQCGRPSTKHCSHKTYYGIAGYRNTCPIAGISGTYTKPATLRLFFNLKKKEISSSAKIEEVRISFYHRCTGVDVANGKETTVWGPNFNGGDKYPYHHALTVKIGNNKQTSDKNPPLSSKFGKTKEFVFKDVSYEDLTKNGVDIIYGSNLETNPGNIYIKKLVADIKYTDEEMYIEGKQDKDSLYTSVNDNCATPIVFTLEAGYKHGDKKISPSKSPKILNTDIICTSDNLDVSYTYNSNNKTTTATLYDKTGITGNKKVTFKIKNTNKSITFEYKALKRKRPNIEMIGTVWRNTKTTVPCIIANDGCCSNIKVYHEELGPTPFYEFQNFDIDNTGNIIQNTDIDTFYRKLVTDPSMTCKEHKFIFIVDNEDSESATIKYLTVLPTVHEFKIFKSDGVTELSSPCKIKQDKNNSNIIKVKYLRSEQILGDPTFTIKNGTHKKDNNGNPVIVGNENWTPTASNLIKDVTVGRYHPGKYDITIEESVCPGNPKVFTVNIVSNHKQYFDEIFVRGEDSTAFNYKYLVALEGDSITEPIFVNNVSVGTSFDDIKICAKDIINTGLGKIDSFDLTVTNTSSEDIENLFLELNTLVKDDDDKLEVTTSEWVDNGGIFYNFAENFKAYNINNENFITTKNLTPDDDTIDEEDVYIHIKKLLAGQSVPIKIPFSSNRQKEVYLQVLLFGEVMKIYDCTNNSKISSYITIKIVDSTATSLSITGNMDLFNPEKEGCLGNCYKSEAIKYKITNIDTNTLPNKAETCISNDPRLVPYKIVYNNISYENPKTNTPSNVRILSGETYTDSFALIGEKVNIFTKFFGYDEDKIYKYTDANGEVIFYIDIPITMGGSYTIQEFLEFLSIEYEGSYYSNQKIKRNNSYSGETRNYKRYNADKNIVDFEVLNINDPYSYFPGQSIPIKIKLTAIRKYFQNDIMFKADISGPNTSDDIDIYYKICGLPNDEGKLRTIFKTNDDNNLLPNEIMETIYCGMKTDMRVSTRIKKVILENKTLNRLYISLNNRKRNNKDIIVQIIEANTSNSIKYDIIDYKIDTGVISINDNQILWNIDYIEEDTIINGYIDFKAKETGFSNLKVTVKDFIDSMPKE